MEDPHGQQDLSRAIPDPPHFDETYMAQLLRDVPPPPQIDRNTRKFSTISEAEAALKVTVHPQLKYNMMQPRFEQRSPQWHAARKSAITASSFGAAAGIAEYGTPVQVFREKIDTAPKEFSPFARACMDHGVKYEDAAAHRFERETGETLLDFGLLSHWQLWQLKPATTDSSTWFDLIHADAQPACFVEEEWALIQELRWLKGSPDGITASGKMVEFKCPRSKFTPGQVRCMYYAQVQLNMELAGVDECYFVQYMPQESWLFGEKYDCTIIKRDREWFREHKERARQVWTWIRHFHSTGLIHSDVVGKVRLTAASSPPHNIITESTRKRSLAPDNPGSSRSNSRRSPPKIDFASFPPGEETWADEETPTTTRNRDNSDNEPLSGPPPSAMGHIILRCDSPDVVLVEKLIVAGLPCAADTGTLPQTRACQ